MSRRTPRTTDRSVHDRTSKNHLYDGFAIIGRALANGRRLEILELLSQSQLSVREISERIRQSDANTSQHLQVLAASGLVASRREGRQVMYRSAPGAATLLDAVRSLAVAQIDAIEGLVDSYLGTRDDFEWLTRAELRRRLRNKSIVVLDVRTARDFQAGHIEGALSIPLDELAERLGEIPRGRDVVAYCRGPFCALGDDAVRILRRRGFRALRLEDGFPQWAREVQRA
jgi:rhodanese-related sulfurtransferase